MRRSSGEIPAAETTPSFKAFNSPRNDGVWKESTPRHDVNDLEEVFRGNPQGPDEPVLDRARHPTEPSLVVLAFEDVDLGEGHLDLLSCRHSRTTAELLMGFRRPPMPAGFMKRTQ